MKTSSHWKPSPRIFPTIGKEDAFRIPSRSDAVHVAVDFSPRKNGNEKPRRVATADAAELCVAARRRAVVSLSSKQATPNAFEHLPADFQCVEDLAEKGASFRNFLPPCSSNTTLGFPRASFGRDDYENVHFNRWHVVKHANELDGSCPQIALELLKRRIGKTGD